MDEDGKSERNHYPSTFGCPFCGREFSLMSSVFSHMRRAHISSNSQDNHVIGR